MRLCDSMILNSKEKQISYINSLLFFILLFLLDQCSKVLVSKIMLENGFSNINILSFLDIVFVRNTGISFGLFSEGGQFNRYFFSMLSLLVGSMLILASFFMKNKLLHFSFIFISAGALGNATDRIYFGGVIDFIDFFIYNFHWPAFNFADVFITLGVFFLIIDSFTDNRKYI